MKFNQTILRLFMHSIVANALVIGNINAQAASLDNFDKLLRPPMEYTALKAEGEFLIDGKDTEEDWSRAPWTNFFIDIEGIDKGKAIKETRCKMLWDKEFLYIYVQLEESDIWASIKQRDASVFQDNAFEIFIDPDGDTHNYFEIQLNALGVVWDLFMSKPYRNGGKSLSSWDVKGLKKNINLLGTINDPDDQDKGWSIELAIPFSSLKMSGTSNPGVGEIWRMNLSRVDWDLDVIDGEYQRKKSKKTGRLEPANYSVWSPQGIINLHYPERYGYILFSDDLSSSSFLSEEMEDSKLLLWKYYYLQKEFKKETGKYATTFQQLNGLYPDFANLNEDAEIDISGSEQQFWMQTKISSLNEQGEIKEIKFQK